MNLVLFGITAMLLTVMDCRGEDDGSHSQVNAEVESQQSHHRHHHHNHHHHSNSHGHRQSNWTVGPPGKSEEGSSSEGSSTTSSSVSSSLERRLQSLENYVHQHQPRYLCMEDAEDVDRRVRNLGIECICPQTEAPVCGSDNVTYHNRCFLHCHARHALLNYHRYRVTLKYFGYCEHAI